MDGAQAPVLTGRIAPLGRALQDQDNLVVRQHSGRQLFLQPAGGPRAITPPTVGATAHDVRTIDNQYLHSDSVGESLKAACGIAAYKIPVRIHLRDALPLTANGKISRHDLHEDSRCGMAAGARDPLIRRIEP